MLLAGDCAMSEAGSPVIVIDDDPDIREALVDLLETVELRVEACSSAVEFFAIKCNDGPCCIVLDVRLPGLGGLEFQRRLSCSLRLAPTNRLPVSWRLVRYYLAAPSGYAN